MLKRFAILLALPLALSAQEDLFPLEPAAPSTVTRVTVGAYDQAFPDGGHWKGWTLEGTYFPTTGGPWQVSATTFDRPEGKGATLSAAKYLLLGKASSVYIGLSVGSNHDFLPQAKADVDFRLDLGAGWKLDLGGAFSRFAQDDTVRMLQLGPAYHGGTWSISLRAQHLLYELGGETDTGGILNFRLGNDDFGVWHSLRLAAGRGILESSASGGTLTSTTTSSMTGSGRGRHSITGTTTTTTLTTATVPLPQERLASLTGHWPLTDRFALKAEVSWGEKVATYHFWGGSLQAVFAF